MTVVRTICTQHLVTLNTTELEFPALGEYKTYRYDSFETVGTPLNAWSTSGPGFDRPDTVVTMWVDSPSLGTAGLIIMEAMGDQCASIRSVLTWSVDARWAKAFSQQVDGPTAAAITAKAMH